MVREMELQHGRTTDGWVHPVEVRCERAARPPQLLLHAPPVSPNEHAWSDMSPACFEWRVE